MNIENAKLIYQDLEKAWEGGEIKQIDMGSYGGVNNLKESELDECETCACFLGWMPVKTRFKPTESDFNEDGFDYKYYSERVFSFSVDEPCRMWDFLFSATWCNHDNTFQGAMKRLKYVIDGNYTDDWKYKDFKEGW